MPRLFAAVVLMLCCANVWAESSGDLIEWSGVQGGLIVHLGCGDGQLTAKLGSGDRYLVHGLDTDTDSVTNAKAHIHSLGLYGRISVDTFDGIHLPYADNLVNLIVADNLGRVPTDEVMRVLAPLGVALIGENKIVKPWPKEIDQWTHYLHGPDNNAVAKDTAVGNPRSLQWVGEPRWGRSHEELASMSACVSARGRLFYIVDESPIVEIGFPPDWKLVARDAFNGIVLWKKDLSGWMDHLRWFRSGPQHLARRLVAVDDKVFVTLGLNEPVEVVDAASGETLQRLDGTEHTEEILVENDTVYLVVGTSENDLIGDNAHRRGASKPTDRRWMEAIDLNSGRLRWRVTAPEGEFLMPLSLAVKGSRVFYHTSRGLYCLNASDGEQVWGTARKTPSYRYAWSVPTLVATEEVVLLADRLPGTVRVQISRGETKDVNVPPAEDSVAWMIHCMPTKNVADYEGPVIPWREVQCLLTAYSAETGETLWSAPASEGYNSPADVFVAGGLAWFGSMSSGHDLETGEVRRQIRSRSGTVGMAHPRCHRNKATENIIFTCRSGIEVVSLEDGWLGNNSWVRGTCQYGIMPCNGLIYAPPNACACFNKVKLQGFLALSGQRKATPERDAAVGDRLVKGAAYDRTAEASASPHKSDWPMYRHDVQRSGSLSAALPNSMTQRWAVSLGGRLTQPVSANGLVVVASVDTHAVYAFDSQTGKNVWTYVAGGRVDSSPTIWRERVIFGCRNGCVYCLDTQDGTLAWRYKAAPQDRLITAFGQLESSWPLHGAVLVQNDKVYAIAGRNSYIDGGLHLAVLDAATGAQLFKSTIHHLDPNTGKQTGKQGGKTLAPLGYAGFEMEGSLNDVLSGDGQSVYLKHLTFDESGQAIADVKPHLLSPTGLLGEDWYVRSYWTHGVNTGSGYFNWGAKRRGETWINQRSNTRDLPDNRVTQRSVVPAGRILSFDDSTFYGYGRRRQISGLPGHHGNQYHLFRLDDGAEAYAWSRTDSITVRAMTLASKKLVIAGVPSLGSRSPEDSRKLANSDEARAAYLGERGGLLQVVSADNGTVATSLNLPSAPVFDGMALADGQVLISLKNGQLICLGHEQ